MGLFQQLITSQSLTDLGLLIPLLLTPSLMIL